MTYGLVRRTDVASDQVSRTRAVIRAFDGSQRSTDLDRRRSPQVKSLGQVLALLFRMAIWEGLAGHWDSVPVGRRSASLASVPAGPAKVHRARAETTLKHCPTDSCYRRGTRMEYQDQERQCVALD
jgi:hypothetical protein